MLARAVALQPRRSRRTVVIAMVSIRLWILRSSFHHFLFSAHGGHGRRSGLLMSASCPAIQRLRAVSAMEALRRCATVIKLWLSAGSGVRPAGLLDLPSLIQRCATLVSSIRAEGIGRGLQCLRLCTHAPLRLFHREEAEPDREFSVERARRDAQVSGPARPPSVEDGWRQPSSLVPLGKNSATPISV